MIIWTIKKIKKNELIFNFKGSKNKNNKLLIKSFDLNEDKNFIKIKNLVLNEKLQISGVDHVDLDYFDQDRQKNSIRLKKNKRKYFLTGSSFNADNFIEDLLSNDDEGLTQTQFYILQEPWIILI